MAQELQQLRRKGGQWSVPDYDAEDALREALATAEQRRLQASGVLFCSFMGGRGEDGWQREARRHQRRIRARVSPLLPPANADDPPPTHTHTHSIPCRQRQSWRSWLGLCWSWQLAAARPRLTTLC